MSEFDIHKNSQLVEYLSSFLTENKRAKMAEVIAHRTRHVSVIIEDIFQPHNASAVVRSCEIFGIQDLHIIEKQYNFAVQNSVAMGARKWIDMHHYKSTPECLEKLKSHGYRIVATRPDPDAKALPDLPLEKKCALLFGTENTGLTEQALDLADEFMVIPMYGFTESFNISVSVALCLYDMIHRLQKSDIDWRLSEVERMEVQLGWLKKHLRGADELIRQFEREGT